MPAIDPNADVGAASLTDWLQAIGGIGAAVTAIVLAVLAYMQMRATNRQAKAADDQVRLMRADAEEERRHRDTEATRVIDEQAARDRTVREQIDALSGITFATRDAARAQLQPIVFAHTVGPHIRGPNDDLDISEGYVAFQYRLANEGVGPALNIRHGVEVGGAEYAFGDGMEVRALRPGEVMPPWDPVSGRLVVLRPLTAVAPQHELPADGITRPVVYWARFENVFGEKFETRNPTDPHEPAGFSRLGAPPSQT